MDSMLKQTDVEVNQNEGREEGAKELSDLQLLLVGGGNVTVIVG